jgi:hypothetical protein
MAFPNRIRRLLGLSALAAFGALELALVGTIVGFAIEMAFGIDLPLINWVDAGSRAS